MTDSYIKQVAEAVRKAIVKEVAGVMVCNCCWDAVDVPEHCSEIAGDIDLGAIIASVPTPEPVATKLETGQFECFHASTEDAGKMRNLPVGAQVYTYPPDAQAEIDRLQKEYDSKFRKVRTLTAELQEALRASRHEARENSDAQAEIAALRLWFKLEREHSSMQSDELVAFKAEINRLNTKATEREGFIERLMTDQHAELMRVADLMAWAPGSDCERIVDLVEQERREC